jgi:hypothetical protein
LKEQKRWLDYSRLDYPSMAGFEQLFQVRDISAWFGEHARRARGRTRASVVGSAKTPIEAAERNLSLSEAAAAIGVSYSTARRMLAHEEGVRRFSTTTAGDAVVYPGQRLKRYQRVRLTFVIPESVVERVKRRMAGELAA